MTFPLHTTHTQALHTHTIINKQQSNDLSYELNEPLIDLKI